MALEVLGLTLATRQDFLIMPLLMAGMFMFQLGKGNMYVQSSLRPPNTVSSYLFFCFSIFYNTSRYIFPLRPCIGSRELTLLNSGNAATDFFREEIGINQSQFNIGVSMAGVATAISEASDTHQSERTTWRLGCPAER